MAVREAGRGGADAGGYASAHAGPYAGASAHAEGNAGRYAGGHTGGYPGGSGGGFGGGHGGDHGGGHFGGCACGDCPHGAREGHRRAVAAFLRRRDEFAAGQGLPAAVAHSASASRQWVSEELAQSAELVAERGRAEGQAWLTRLWRRTTAVVWAAVVLLLLGQALTAIGVGWTAAHTAGLAAALATALSLTAASWFHRARGGVLAPVIGEDNRLSTSRTVAAAWVLFVAYAVLVLAGRLAAASRQRERDALISGLDLARGAGIVTVLAVVCGIAVLVRRVVGLRVLGQRLQKVRADRPRAADLLTDDAGRGTFADIQYIVISGVALVFAAVRLARRPEQLPDLPWGLAVVVLVSAATYLAGKYAEGGRPVILSVVRAREAGDLDGPIRTGDDIEIRGAGFVPPGAQGADRLARMVVRVGTVHVHVPLIPVPGGFRNPTDTVLTVPVPADVEPGRVEVQVVTAAGVETNRYAVDVTE
ncbi:hypothetical protein [Streptomyces sp. NPDC007984]|uniref:hypothetical protein n=1 Tax=Streptomyces sp. NPDC007984 TaxID=3364801 RepID=UPI0036EF16CD